MLTLARSFAEAVEWCEPRIDLQNPKWCLRSSQLQPDVEASELHDTGFFNSTRLIHYVANRRSELVSVGEQSRPLSGRLLMANFEITNFNAATEIESDGFFDWADNPPWDLWLGVYQNQLLSWIPPEFIDTVGRSILVECMDMFQWTNLEEIGLQTIIG